MTLRGGSATMPGPAELLEAQRKYGRARVIEVGPRGMIAYASIYGKYLGVFDMSQHEGPQPGLDMIAIS